MNTLSIFTKLLETQTEVKVEAPVGDLMMVAAGPIEVAAVPTAVPAPTPAIATAKVPADVRHELPVKETKSIESFKDISTGDAIGDLSLLELAETIDQHKLWVESAGEEGTKADFSGVNFANADLTGVNLQGATLNKAKLTDADLSMANLRGASLVQADLRNDPRLVGRHHCGEEADGLADGGTPLHRPHPGTHQSSPTPSGFPPASPHAGCPRRASDCG